MCDANGKEKQKNAFVCKINQLLCLPFTDKCLPLQHKNDIKCKRYE